MIEHDAVARAHGDVFDGENIDGESEDIAGRSGDELVYGGVVGEGEHSGWMGRNVWGFEGCAQAVLPDVGALDTGVFGEETGRQKEVDGSMFAEKPVQEEFFQSEDVIAVEV